MSAYDQWLASPYTDAGPDREADAMHGAMTRFDKMEFTEIVALANEALDAEDHANAVWPLRHKLCAHLAAKIAEGSA